MKPILNQSIIVMISFSLVLLKSNPPFNADFSAPKEKIQIFLKVIFLFLYGQRSPINFF